MPHSTTSSDSSDSSDTGKQTPSSNRAETFLSLCHASNSVGMETSLAMLFLHFTGYFDADSISDKILNHPATWTTFIVSLVTNIILNLTLELREAKTTHKINTERLAFLAAISTALAGTTCSLTKLAKASAFLFSAAFLLGFIGFSKINLDTISNAKKIDDQGRAIYRPFTRLLLNLIRPTTNSLLQFLAFLTPVLGFGVASDAIPEACFMGTAVSLIRIGLAYADITDHMSGFISGTNLSTLIIDGITQNPWSFFDSNASNDTPENEEEEPLLDDRSPAVNKV